MTTRQRRPHLPPALLGSLATCMTLLLCCGSVWAADTARPARAGASIYSVSCASCHTYGMRGAPKLTDKAAWAPRLAQPPGMLYTHVVKGLGWMPPRGTCSTCSDEEIKAAVDYMVSRLPKP